MWFLFKTYNFFVDKLYSVKFLKIFPIILVDNHERNDFIQSITLLPNTKWCQTQRLCSLPSSDLNISVVLLCCTTEYSREADNASACSKLENPWTLRVYFKTIWVGELLQFRANDCCSSYGRLNEMQPHPHPAAWKSDNAIRSGFTRGRWVSQPATSIFRPLSLINASRLDFPVRRVRRLDGGARSGNEKLKGINWKFCTGRVHRCSRNGDDIGEVSPPSFGSVNARTWPGIGCK